MEGNYKGKLLFVLNPKLGHATVYSRGLIFKEILAKHNWSVTYVNIFPGNFGVDLDLLRKSEEEIIDLAKGFDVVYLLKVNSYNFVKKLKQYTKAKIVFELADALWKPNFRLAGWYNLEEILQASDALFSENEYVSQYGKAYNKHVYGLTACTQIEKFEKERKGLIPRNNDKVIIGWIGSNGTINAIFSILKPLEKLFVKYPFLELRILGCDSKKLIKPLKNIRYSALASYKEEEMIQEALAMDIGLFPAPSDLDDYRLRGALKCMIYMSAGISPVCLNVGDPAKIIQDGVNGMLINSNDEWITKIEKLILDPALRKDMGSLAYETIREKHSLEYCCNDLENAFLKVMKLERIEEMDLSLSQKFGKVINKLNIVLMMTQHVIKKTFLLSKRLLLLQYQP